MFCALVVTLISRTSACTNRLLYWGDIIFSPKERLPFGKFAPIVLIS